MRIDETDLPYFKADFFNRWKRSNGANRVYDTKVSYDKAPPPIKYGPAPERPSPQKEEKKIVVPPFDLQEIPGVMRDLNMPIAAKLMDRWFSGALNYSPTDDDEQALVNQDGKPYPDSMIDRSTVKLKWVLQFERAKRAYDELVRLSVYSRQAQKAIRDNLRPYRNNPQIFYVNQLCKENLLEIHRRFQFQYAGVESTFTQKLRQYLEREYAFRGIPDDLTAALGSFNFYAAPFKVVIDYNCAFIESIIVYVKDHYTFTDKPGEVSQYLGHWGPKGIVIIPFNEFISVKNIHTTPVGEFYADSAVAVADPQVRGNTYFPVWNSSFREWQKRHYRGGDFVILSDYKAIPLSNPIRVPLE
jgi:hypothetical protein